MEAIIIQHQDEQLIVFTNENEVVDCFEVEKICFQKKYVELFKDIEDQQLVFGKDVEF